MQTPKHNSTIKVKGNFGWLTEGNVYRCEHVRIIDSNKPAREVVVFTHIRTGMQIDMLISDDNTVNFKYCYVQPDGSPLPLITRIVNFFRW